jgi:methylenetetrahydrofolate reductase (NADPH)
VAQGALAAALASGRFVYVAELVASGTKREDEVLTMASHFSAVPALAGVGVTSYAGGKAGHDPIRIAAGVQALGLTPNVHVTCVSRTRQDMSRTLDTLTEQKLFNVFAISGDWPQADASSAVFDMDSVQLVSTLAGRRAIDGTPFYISVAVSPFKYQREDCLYQYVKLEKTQVGWDARKFAELKRYLDERGLETPLLGNVYVLGHKAAQRMATGNPPGCWASPELVEAIGKETEGAPDKGLQARLERAALTVAVLRGLGYAGAYLGGTHDAGHMAWIVQRAEELAPQWEELQGRLQFGRTGGFYLYDAPSEPKPARTFLPMVLDAAGKSLPVPWAKAPRDTAARRAIAGFFAWIDRHATLSHLFERFEYYSKKEIFGCRNCGNCVLGSMEYVCPQTCPKQMRNGPCGGTNHGQCEVIPEQACIWVRVMERAEASDQVDGLKTFVPPPDRTLTGTASWLNFYLERDSRPGRPKAWDEPTSQGPRP